MDEERRSKQGTVVVFSMLFINDIACGAIVEAVAQLRKSPRCERQFKYGVGQLDSFRKNYERRLAKILRQHRYGYMEMCDIYTEGAKPRLDVMFYSLRNLYLKAKVQEVDAFTRFQYARILVTYAAVAYAKRIPQAVAALGGSGRFAFLDFRQLQRYMDSFAEAHMEGVDIYLEEVQHAVNSLTRYFDRGEPVADAVNKASEIEDITGEWKI